MHQNIDCKSLEDRNKFSLKTLLFKICEWEREREKKIVFSDLKVTLLVTPPPPLSDKVVVSFEVQIDDAK